MYAVAVNFELVPGREDQFLPLMYANARTSLESEPGCQQFDVCTDPEAPRRVLLYELYTDRAAFDAHLMSTHFKTFDNAVAPMIAHKTVQCFSQVSQ